MEEDEASGMSSPQLNPFQKEEGVLAEEHPGGETDLGVDSESSEHAGLLVVEESRPDAEKDKQGEMDAEGRRWRLWDLASLFSDRKDLNPGGSRPHGYLWEMNMLEDERLWWQLLEKGSFSPWKVFKQVLGKIWSKLTPIIPWAFVPPGPWKRGHEGGRVVGINKGRPAGEANGLSTSKYQPWNFLFKFFFEQYRRISNIYFTIVMLINFIPGVSPILPVTSVIPLLFVLGTAMVKELLEDTFRHVSDYRINSQKFHVVRSGGTVTIPSKKIRPGDIIRVDNDQQIPADMVLLCSTEPEGAAYVTTANLDGETNLKLHKAVPLTALLGGNEEKIRLFRGTIECGPPDKNLYLFSGKLTVESFPVEGQDSSTDDLAPVRLEPSRRRKRASTKRRLNLSTPASEGFHSLITPFPNRARGMGEGGGEEMDGKRSEDMEMQPLPNEHGKYIGEGNDDDDDDEEDEDSLELSEWEDDDHDDMILDEEEEDEEDEKELLNGKPKKINPKNNSSSSRDQEEEEEEEEDDEKKPMLKSSWAEVGRPKEADRPGEFHGMIPSSVVEEEENEAVDVNLMEDFQAVWPLDKAQLLLRGSQLRNTKHAYGVVVYAGKKTKLFLNLSKPPSKFSTVDKMLNGYVFTILIVQQVIVLLCAIASVVWEDILADDSWYLGSNPYSPAYYLVRNFLTYFVLFNIFVPISMWVTLEVVRTLQARFIGWDAKMRSANGREGPIARTANLNEDLGMIDFVFSDKTGTLTANIMEFRNASVGGHVYGAWEGLKFAWMADGGDRPMKPVERVLAKLHLTRALKVRDMVVRLKDRVQALRKKGTSDPAADPSAEDGGPPAFERIDEKDLGPLGDMGRALLAVSEAERASHPLAQFLRVVTVCHACVADHDPVLNDIVYRTPSPDEKALVEAARANGYFYVHRSTDSVTVYELGVPQTYRLLATIEFTSSRKRMTTIVQTPSGEIWLLAKGANNVMFDRVSPQCDAELLRTTDEHVRHFAGTGLRTLVMAQRRLSEEEYRAWKLTFDEAATALEDREARIEQAATLIERDWHVLGCSAIEDRLQDEVPETIYFLRQAGIQVWVLTGDMQETARFIGYSSRLLDEDTDLMVLNAESSDDCGRQMIELIRRKCPVDSVHAIGARSLRDRLVNIPFAQRILQWLPARLRMENKALAVPNPRLALIIDGKTLEFCLNDHREKFRWLGRACNSVICCRVSPLQKARVVETVREGEGKISLAIGDGANDVSMIQKAHVGVGIFGKEGTQAARSSDYAIHEFKHLRRLLSVHGRFNFLRSSGLIQYSFYKNIAFSLPFLYVSFTNGFTGLSPYDSWTITFFNMLFTALPPGMYGIWERDVPERACELYPQLYRPLHQKAFFTKWTFLRWILSAVWHSAVVYCLHLAYYWGNNNVMLGGLDGDLYAMGFSMSLCLIIIVNLRMLIEVEFLNWLWILVSFGTMMFVLAFQYAFNLIYHPGPYFQPFTYLGWPEYFNNTYGVATLQFQSPFFWFMFSLCVVTALLPDLLIKYVRRTFFPEGWVIVRKLYRNMREDLRLQNQAIDVYARNRKRSVRRSRRLRAKDRLARKTIIDSMCAKGDRMVEDAQSIQMWSVDEDEQLQQEEIEHDDAMDNDRL